MDPTPALTPPLDAASDSRGDSVASIKSLVALSKCTGSETSFSGQNYNYSFTQSRSSTARPDHIRCPHCLEIVNMADYVDLNSSSPGSGPAHCVAEESVSPLSTHFQSNSAGSPPPQSHSNEAATLKLQETIDKTEKLLQGFCQELHQIQMMYPSVASSRRTSIHSLLSQVAVDHSGLAIAHPVSGNMEVEASHLKTLLTHHNPHNLLHPDENTAPGVVVASNCDGGICNESIVSHSHAEKRPVHAIRPNFQFDHPLINDLDDLENFTSANVRLLKTMKDRLDKLEKVEKMLQEERDTVEMEKLEVQQLRSDVEQERLRLMKTGINWQDYKINGNNSRSAVIIPAAGEITPEDFSPTTENTTEFDDWTEEKQKKLAELEEKLKKSNRQWSDDQELIIGPLEKLREEKRQQEKSKKLERQMSPFRLERNWWSPDERPEKSSVKFEEKINCENRCKSSNQSTPISIRGSISGLVRSRSVSGRKTSSDSSNSRKESNTIPTLDSPKPRKLFKNWF